MQSKLPNINGMLCPLCGRTPGDFFSEDPEIGLCFLRCKSCGEYIKYLPDDNAWVKFDYKKYEVEEKERKLREKIGNKSIEAREWLDNNLNSTPLAGNRFRDLEEARIFVQKLYNAGAVRVDVVDVEESAPGHRYTDTLVVTMPKLKELRDEIFTIYNKESTREVGESEEDIDQTTLTF